MGWSLVGLYSGLGAMSVATGMALAMIAAPSGDQKTRGLGQSIIVQAQGNQAQGNQAQANKEVLPLDRQTASVKPFNLPSAPRPAATNLAATNMAAIKPAPFAHTRDQTKDQTQSAMIVLPDVFGHSDQDLPAVQTRPTIEAANSRAVGNRLILTAPSKELRPQKVSAVAPLPQLTLAAPSLQAPKQRPVLSLSLPKDKAVQEEVARPNTAQVASLGKPKAIGSKRKERAKDWVGSDVPIDISGVTFTDTDPGQALFPTRPSLLPKSQGPNIMQPNSPSFIDLGTAKFSMTTPLPLGEKASAILVQKSQRLMHLMQDGQLLKSYKIDLGFNPVGHKLSEGDGKTPEGDYVIDWRNAKSKFYRSLHISYPNVNDVQVASLAGRDPGGAIMIHGRPNGYSDNIPLGQDWTAGCIAVSNAHMKEIWRVVADTTPISIRP